MAESSKSLRIVFICALWLSFSQSSRAQSYFFSTLAGSPTMGNDDGAAADARFASPTSAAVDSAGNIYICDPRNNAVRKLSTSGLVSTIGGKPGHIGSVDGQGASARFDLPAGIAIDANDNVFIADSGAYVIRKITPAGVVTTFAGAAYQGGNQDGTGATARFFSPQGIAFDSAGNLFVADMMNHVIRKITPTGLVSTFAGSVGTAGSADGVGTQASFRNPTGLAFEPSGSLYVTSDHALRKISPGGVVSTVAGSPGSWGSVDGGGTAARFLFPKGITTDGAGNVYIADPRNNVVRKVTPAGNVSTYAGLMQYGGSKDGDLASARFWGPEGVTFDRSGNLIVVDSGNNTLRSISPGGQVTTLAGQPHEKASTYADGEGARARFSFPQGMVVTASGDLLVADSVNFLVRKVTKGGAVSIFAGTPQGTFSSDGTRFQRPADITLDSEGAPLVGDGWLIRTVSPGGFISTLAGNGAITGPKDGVGADARFGEVNAVLYHNGAVFVADATSIRKMQPPSTVTTFAGALDQSGSADGVGAAARFGRPMGLAVDKQGYLFVADANSHTIRRVAPDGTVTTYSGQTGLAGSTDGSAAVARFSQPTDVAVDASGNVFVADNPAHVVRRIAPDGMVTTIGGRANQPGSVEGAGDHARLTSPRGLALASDGTLYVSCDDGTIRVGRPALAPSITTQPVSQSVSAGSNVQFEVVVQSLPAASYQWRRNQIVVAGATEATLRLSNVQQSDAGDFSVVITNDVGSVTSNNATLTVSSGSTGESGSSGTTGSSSGSNRTSDGSSSTNSGGSTGSASSGGSSTGGGGGGAPSWVGATLLIWLLAVRRWATSR